MLALKNCCLAVTLIACQVIKTKKTSLFLSQNRVVNARRSLLASTQVSSSNRLFLFHHKHGCHQSGFSMIELLVAMLVFSVGLLGMASLQITGLRMARDADLMALASLYASSMADQIRANSSVGVDSSEWKRMIQTGLPQGLGEVKFDNHRHTISISWAESQDSINTERQRVYELVVHL